MIYKTIEEWNERNPNHIGPLPIEVCRQIWGTKDTLAQPEQEPVKMVAYNCTCGRTMKFESVHGVVAPQRTWVGLTDEDRAEILNRKWWNFEDEFDVDGFLRLAEAKLKDKNT